MDRGASIGTGVGRGVVLLAAASLGSCTVSNPLVDAATPPVDASAPRDAGPMAVDAYLPVTGCPGEPPVDDDGCVQGDGWRDCGGTSAPRFACEPAGRDCAWFDGGCVPTSWIPSPCAAEHLCCVDGWAFGPHAFEEPGRADVFFQLQQLGLQPPDRIGLSRIAVVVDPDLVVGTSVALSCRGEESALCPAPDRRGPPPPPTGGADRSDDTLSVFAYPPPTFGTTLLLVEVDPEDPTRARACIVVSSDFITWECPTTPPPRCADAGTLIITDIPSPRSGRASIGAHLEARFGELELTFELPPM